MPGKRNAVEEQPPEAIACALEDFLAAHPAAVLQEDGRMLFDMRSSRYSIAQDHGRCTLHLWSEERNLVRRVTGTLSRKGLLRLATVRFGQSAPQMLDLVADSGMRTPTARDSARSRYASLLERVLERNFPGWTCERFHSAMDLEKSFGPAYARGIFKRGQDAWAVVGVNSEEVQATVDGILTVGLLWLQQCRERAAGRVLFQGLRVVVPVGTAPTTLCRMAWLRADAAKWEIYELAESTEQLEERDIADTGNLSTRLTHAVDPVRTAERFADEIALAMALVPANERGRVEIRPRSSTEVALLLHGLQFARIHHRASATSFARTSEIIFGAGAQETLLDAGSEPMLRRFVERLFERRRACGSAVDPLFRMAPEAWLEASLRENIAQLTEPEGSLWQFDPSAVYAQVAAFQAGDRGMLDLLTVTRDGRLAVLELKAHEDMHFALQGLDYWLRVRFHHAQAGNSATGLGSLQEHGYFPSLRLSPLPPRLYLVAPSLRIHPATETVLRFLKPEIEWTVLGLNEKWREGVRVITRLRSSASARA